MRAKVPVVSLEPRGSAVAKVDEYSSAYGKLQDELDRLLKCLTSDNGFSMTVAVEIRHDR